MTLANSDYDVLIEQISTTYESGRKQTVRQVQTTLLHTYWTIGQHIVEFEQGGQAKASYGKNLLPTLARELTTRLGKGFSRVNLTQMRQIYLRYPNADALSPTLTYSHYVELSSIGDDLERSFYEQQCVHENWSLQELRRQKSSSLFLRLAASRDKQGILALSKKGQSIVNPTDLLRDPYVLEFLKIPEYHKYTEGELETRLMDNLQGFLLELGKGFTFVGRQYPISINKQTPQGRLSFLPSNSSMLCSNRPKNQRSKARRHRPDEYVHGLFCQ